MYDTNCAEKQIASCNAGYELQNGTCVLKNYTISYELNGGTNSDSNPNSYTVVSPTKVLQSPKRQGYTFVNWYTDSGSSVSQITNGTIGNIKLYAEWEPTSIKINYQCNGTTTKTQTCTIESTSCKLDPDVCEKSGFYYDYYVFDAVGSDIISSNFLKTDDLVTNGFVAELLAKPGNFWNQGAVINLVPDYKNLYTVPMQFNPACTKLTGQMPTNMTDCTNVSCVLPDANIECMGYREWNKVWLINNALTFNDMPFAVGTDIKDIVQEHNQELINVPVMVFPGWEPIEYTVIYQPNRPTQSTDVVVGEVSSTDHTYNTKKKVQQNTYSLRGYTSNGWNTEPDGSGTPIASGEEVENLTSIDGDNVTLYAQYTANTITIKLDDDLGDTSYTETSCTYGDKFTLPGTYRTGYTGYWTGSKNYFIPYQEYDCTYENLGVYEGEVTLTSAWTANTYTITFNANGGSGGQTTSKTATYDAVPPPITTTKPTKSGYAFMGYYDTSATTGGTQYYNANMDAVGVWNKTSDAVLYARWVSATSTLTINYTCIDGTTVSSKCVDGAPCYIGCADALSQCSVPVCIADGYNITGYKLTDDSTGNVLGEYKHNHNASGMPKYHTGQSWTMTAIPQMVANEYSITYKDGDNTISGLIPTSYTVETTTFSLPTPIKTGYTFVSWHTDKELTSPAIAQIKKGTIGNNTYYAKWKANRTTITLNKNANDATDGTSRVIAIYGDVMPTPITLPTRHGYTFAGYYDTSATSGGTQYYTATGASAHNWNQNTGGTGLYARWIPNTYKITLDNQGATTAGTSEFYFQYGTDKYYVDRELTQEIIKITLPTKTGYTFNCYAHTPAGGSTEIAVDGTIDTPYVMQLPQDSTIYAQWKANTYTVTFNSNNGKSQTKTQSFTYDVAQNLQQNTFSHPGYTFLGWSMNKDATTVQYTDVQSVKNLTTEINGNVTLYAVWEANKLNITYSANGGKGTAPSKPIVCPIDSVCEIPANTYSKTGYDFAGWGCSGQNSCDVDPTMPVDANLWNYVKFDSVTDGEYITLYPKWTAKKITCNVGEYLDILTCRSCEAGYKCPSTSVTYTYNTEVQGLVACSAATEYQNQPGQTMCKIVDDGYYKTSDTTQVQCGNNYYCKNSVRTQCADGGITATATASLATQCYKTGQSCTTVGGFGTNTCNFNLTTKDYTDCAQCIVDGCDDGYYLDNGTCVICPVGSYCANSVKTSCPINYTTKQTGAVTDVECFTTCSDKEVVYGTAFADKPEVFWSAACTYTYGISVTGNPCKIINNVCVETSCNYDYEMINGKCELCVRDNALTFKSGAGNCIVESCLYGYHPFDQSCVPNTRECSIDGALSAEQKWDTKTNNFGPCMVTECAEGYHIDANTCVLDVQTCKLENGMGEKVYNHDLKKWGDCVVTTCKPGYTNDPSQTNETWKQCGQCNNMFGANGERAVSSYLTECEIASCMYQGEKYILENNECVLICDERSDETGFRYWDGKKCVHECSPGFLTW